MPQDRRRSVKTRRPRELDLAYAMTIFFGIAAVTFYSGGGLNGKQSPEYVVLFALLAAVAWWWALRTIKARNAAGKTLAQLQALTPDQFEEWVAARFRDLGYSVKVTGLSGDHGADLLAEKQGELTVIQCKNYKAWSVGEPVLRDLYGTMHDFQATKAYLVTTGQLTKPAVEWVKGKPIEVWDGEHLDNLSSRPTDKSRVPAPSGAVEPPRAARSPNELPTTDSATGPTCPRCGATLVERRNRRTGEAFLACPRYPECRHAEPLTSTAL